MNPSITPAALPANLQAPASAHGGFAGAWLRIDLALCIVRALAAFATLVALGSLADDSDFARISGWSELILGTGVAAFGIAGNLLLLRGRRLGLVMMGISLLFVALSLLGAYGSMAYRLAYPDEASCPPADLVAGVILGTLMRASINVVTMVVLGQVARRLNSSRSKASF